MSDTKELRELHDAYLTAKQETISCSENPLSRFGDVDVRLQAENRAWGRYVTALSARGADILDELDALRAKVEEVGLARDFAAGAAKNPHLYKAHLVLGALLKALDAVLADTPKEEKCAVCGKPKSDGKHIRYGNDLDNPVKHEFVADAPKPECAKDGKEQGLTGAAE